MYYPEKRHRPPFLKEGVDYKKIHELFQKIVDAGDNMQSILIVKNGYLAVEEYFPPYHREYLHAMNSNTKAVVSALVGIAIEEESLKVDQKVLDFFPDSETSNICDWKQSITIFDLLTLRSGLSWGGGEIDDVEFVLEMAKTKKWAEYCLNRPMKYEPGTHFDSISACPQILAAILTKVTGKNLHEYAREKLFDPIGISNTVWWESPSGENGGNQGLFMKPIDRAKFGLLYLRNGLWEGKQIIPSDWIEKSKTAFCKTEPKQQEAFLAESGYMWYIDADFPVRSYNINGIHGNFIYIIDELDLVVVTTAHLPRSAENLGNQHRNQIHLYMKKYIIPACSTDVQSDSCMLEAIRNLTKPTTYTSFNLPDIAQRISGKTYYFSVNYCFFEDIYFLYHISSLKLNFGNQDCEAEVQFVSGDSISFTVGLNGDYKTVSIKTYLGNMPISAKGEWKNNVFTIVYNTWWGNKNHIIIRPNRKADIINCKARVEFFFEGKVAGT